MPILKHIPWLLRWLACAMLVSAGGDRLRAETLIAPEYKIKAAFLYNFAVLTEWPTNAFASDDSPLTIGVFGTDPFERLLKETMRGKAVSGRKIDIARYKRIPEVQRCHLLFISSDDGEQLDDVLEAIRGRPILTVSDIDCFNHRGGMIWLRKENDQITFRIRRELADEAGLKLSSRLVALSVNGKLRQRGKTEEEK